MPVPQICMPLATGYSYPAQSIPPQRSIIKICSPLSLPSTLVWDIRKPPSSATTTIGQGRAIFSAATAPITDHIAITCRIKIINKIWSDIEVTESPVTIDCVLKAIYDYFQEKITEEEYRAIQELNPRKYPDLLNNARNERARLLIQKRESVYRVPLRRVDCLGDKHTFEGLEVEYLSDGSQSVVLHLV